MYNSISVVIFHFSWKMQSDVWGSVTAKGISHITGGNFALSANTVNGWLRDFLWACNGWALLMPLIFQTPLEVNTISNWPTVT